MEQARTTAAPGGFDDERDLARVATGMKLLGIGLLIMIVAGVLGAHS